MTVIIVIIESSFSLTALFFPDDLLSQQMLAFLGFHLLFSLWFWQVYSACFGRLLLSPAIRYLESHKGGVG